ncbi:hypothetical protein NGB36_18195 [Streptomyces sp. RB6PN25]|uniref:Uncharacterized protein n=1 Tax=Streptomyces humicola TaxID=2953240 RepID=A0ABT1PZI7_9ACTN|nr:hypothetical protein [Streptomyces humicola]MCQ4082480.1 hypothetical protein [Streptomyces humicola]
MFTQVHQQRTQLEADDCRRTEDMRRQACDDLLSASARFAMAWWRVADKLDDGEANEDLYQETAKEWVEVTGAQGRVAIAGPGPLATTGIALFQQLKALDEAGTAWYWRCREEDRHGLDKCAAQFREAIQAVAMHAFATAAREALGND